MKPKTPFQLSLTMFLLQNELHYPQDKKLSKSFNSSKFRFTAEYRKQCGSDDKCVKFSFRKRAAGSFVSEHVLYKSFRPLSLH